MKQVIRIRVEEISDDISKISITDNTTPGTEIHELTHSRQTGDWEFITIPPLPDSPAMNWIQGICQMIFPDWY